MLKVRLQSPELILSRAQRGLGEATWVETGSHTGPTV